MTIFNIKKLLRRLAKLLSSLYRTLFIKVKICIVSYLKARPECPPDKVKLKLFLVNKAPTCYCNVHKKPEPPEPPEPKPPKLRVENDKIFFLDGGKRETFLVGVSRREAWHRDLGIFTKDKLTWKPYSYDWYIEQVKKYRLNYFRHDAISNCDYMRKRCIEIYEKCQAVVEVTLGDGSRDLGYFDNTIAALKDLPNIVFEVWNEMKNDDDVETAYNYAKKLAKLGLICSGGAIGAGKTQYADKFFAKNPPVTIIQVHRHWPYPSKPGNDWILKYVNHGKPVGRNEYFDMGKLGPNKSRFIMEQSFKHGAKAVNYYGFRIKDLDGSLKGDSAPYYKYLEFAAEVKKQLNK